MSAIIAPPKTSKPTTTSSPLTKESKPPQPNIAIAWPPAANFPNHQEKDKIKKNSKSCLEPTVVELLFKGVISPRKLMRWKENHQDSSESPHPMGKTGLGLPEPILDKLYDHNLVLPPELGLTQNELCQAIMDGVLPK